MADPDGGYAGRYRTVTEAVLARHPSLKVIASGRWMGDGQDVSGSPCLTGAAPCDLWDEHFYRSPDEMVSKLLTRYDEPNYDRVARPKVFVGEYAAPAGCCPPSPTRTRCALRWRSRRSRSRWSATRTSSRRRRLRRSSQTFTARSGTTCCCASTNAPRAHAVVPRARDAARWPRDTRSATRAAAARRRGRPPPPA